MPRGRERAEHSPLAVTTQVWTFHYALPDML
jgi:hypothetical protein